MREKKASFQRSSWRFIGIAAVALCFLIIFAMQSNNLPNRSLSKISATQQRIDQSSHIDDPSANSSTEKAAKKSDSRATPTLTLLTDPFLQKPTDSSVQVVWFTEFEGSDHVVTYADGLTVKAVTTQLSRTREDSDSRVQGRAFPAVTRREIWRHEATVEGLEGGDRLPYAVTSHKADGQVANSKIYTLSANPPKGQPLKILLTSDHQLKPLTPANLQKVAETVSRVDAVFLRAIWSMCPIAPQNGLTMPEDWPCSPVCKAKPTTP